MSVKFEDEPKIGWTEIILEALRGIRSEIFLYAIVVASLIIGTAGFGIEVLRVLIWPLVLIFTLALVAYFIAAAIPRARSRLSRRATE